MAYVIRHAPTTFTPAPEGLHQAVCVDIIDVGVQETPWGPKPKIDIRWELDLPNPDAQGRPYQVTKRYGVSLHEKATLRKDLESWRGRAFTADELSGFDLERLLGANGQLQIVHNVSQQGKTYANVQAIVPLGKTMIKVRPSPDYVRVKDRALAHPESDGAESDEVPF